MAETADAIVPADASLVQSLLTGCPPEWVDYARNCGARASWAHSTSLSMSAADSDVPFSMDESDVSCRHEHFACLFAGEEGIDCRRVCPIALTFAQYSLWRHAMHRGALAEVIDLLSALVYIRMLLPPSCRGGVSSRGCVPLLPPDWFESASYDTTKLKDIFASREVQRGTQIDQDRALGRSIAIVTAFHTSSGYLGEGRWKLKTSDLNESAAETSAPWPWYLENKRCYAEKHDYDFIFDERPMTLDLGVDIDGYRYGIHWVKLAAVREALASHDWVFWIDYDALFANMSQTIEEFIEIIDRNPEVDLVVQNGVDLMPAYSFLLRSTGWSFRFLDRWERYGRHAVWGRSKMWELRCFNCAIVHFLLATMGGQGLHRCGEFRAHVYILMHMLEKYGLNYDQRKLRRSIGKIYFWDPTNSYPRGFLFNPNHDKQQAHFPEAELYHVGDLALHWPRPDKGTPIMREFANEVPGQRFCKRWSSPRYDLPAVYQPLTTTGTPEVFSPRDLIGLASKVLQMRTAVILRPSQEDIATLQPLFENAKRERWARVDVLLGRRASDAERAALQTSVVRLQSFGAISALPRTAFFDFMFIGLDALSASTRGNLTKWRNEISEQIVAGMDRLSFTGILVLPAVNCGRVRRKGKRRPDHAMPDNLLATVIDWGFRLTRAAVVIGGCKWYYYVKPIGMDQYFDMLPGNLHQTG